MEAVFPDARAENLQRPGQRPLAQNICGFSASRSAESLGTFPDGETICKIDEDVRGRDVFLIQPTCPPVNDNLMELLIMIDCCSGPAPTGLPR